MRLLGHDLATKMPSNRREHHAVCFDRCPKESGRTECDYQLVVRKDAEVEHDAIYQMLFKDEHDLPCLVNRLSSNKQDEHDAEIRDRLALPYVCGGVSYDSQ